MEIRERRGLAITGKEVEFNTSELIVLKGLVNKYDALIEKVKELDPKAGDNPTALTRSAGIKYDTRDELAEIVTNAMSLLKKIAPGKDIMSLEEAQNSLFGTSEAND
jgi:hypothetical protein